MHLEYPNILLDALENGIIVLDTDFRVHYWNRWMEINTRVPATQIMQGDLRDFFEEIDYTALARKMKTALSLNTPTFYSGAGNKRFMNIKRHKVTSAYLETMQLKVTITPYLPAEKKVMVSVNDVSELQEIKQALERQVDKVKALNDALERDRAIINQNLMILKIGTDGRILEATDALTRFFDRGTEELTGAMPQSLYDAETATFLDGDIAEALAQGETWRGEMKSCPIRGATFWLDAVITPCCDMAGTLECTAIYHDITDKKRIEALSFTDPLTKVANRARFNEVLTKAIGKQRHTDGVLSLIMMDIDYFKRINDLFGHQGGDHVLREIAALISDEVRKSDLVARWGGEEFVILLPGANREQSILVAEKLQAKIAGHRFRAFPVSVTASFGVTQYLGEGSDSEESMFERADRALYAAKNGGRNRVEYL